jgi:DNA-binding beta-propeller fold protein YncE
VRARKRLAAAALATAVLLGGCGAGSKTPARKAPWPGSAATHLGRGPGHLSVAADTAVLPLNVLIAERDDRLVSISPHGQVVWRMHQADPSQVFVSYTGRTLLIAEAQAAVVVMRRVDNGAVSYRYGQRDRPGAGPGQLREPQTALETSSGTVVIADFGSCRIVFARPGSERATETLGVTGVCVHHPASAPVSFAHPDAAFPAAGGGLVVTERDPAWVDLLDGEGKLLDAIRLRGFGAPSDANAFGADGIVVVDRSDPGKVVELDRDSGAVSWSYGPRSGAGRLDRPTMASVLPDGDLLVADSGNDRVIVIDPKTDAIVWQYGHTGIPGRTPGYLDAPSSITLVPLGK